MVFTHRRKSAALGMCWRHNGIFQSDLCIKIAHCIHATGTQHDLFDAGACSAIFAATGAMPHLVNQLCNLCLVYAWSAGMDHVTALTVEVVVQDGAFFPACRDATFVSGAAQYAKRA